MVPISAAIVYAIGVGIAALLGLAWTTMSPLVRWAIPCVLVLIYLLDVAKREAPQK